MRSFRLPVQADALRGVRPPLNNPGVRLPARPATWGALVTSCGRRTVRTRHPWLVPSFRRRPVGSSLPLVVPQRCGRLWETPAGGFVTRTDWAQAAESGERFIRFLFTFGPYKRDSAPGDLGDCVVADIICGSVYLHGLLYHFCNDTSAKTCFIRDFHYFGLCHSFATHC